MSMRAPFFGPTFEEMRDPSRQPPEVRARALAVRERDPLDPCNLFNITWRDPEGRIYYEVLPRALTGVEAPIVVIYAKDFPTGSHKVGAAYSILMEKVLLEGLRPGEHVLVWPSTGNYGIGGAWVGGRMGFEGIVILPEGMSRERFERIEAYGARVIRTPGSESNVKEIYDKCKELTAADPRVRVLNQFSEMGNYRFHYYVTGNTIVDLAAELRERGIGEGKVAAFVSAMGSAGTIGAGDRLKQVWPTCRVVGVEPIQCPTLYLNGYGVHDIQGIGDKHVTWIHHVMNMDALMCVDDLSCKKGLQLLAEEAGWKVLMRWGVSEEQVMRLSQMFGISGIANVLGAIKTAKFYRFGPKDVIVTVATDGVDRYRSVLAELTRQCGPMDEVEATVRLVHIFHGQGLDWIQEGTQENRRRWHNLKYFTWVEQQGKTVEELDAQLDPEWWEREQARIPELDRLWREARGF
jgi:cysteine synthase